jgi:hypothetical protein
MQSRRQLRIVDPIVDLGRNRSRRTVLMHRLQVIAGQSGWSQNAHVSTAVPHLKHFLDVVA